MKGEGRMSMGLAAFGTVVAAVVVYWWLSGAVLSSLDAVGVIDGRFFMPAVSVPEEVSVSLPGVKIDRSVRQWGEGERPEPRLDLGGESWEQGSSDDLGLFARGYDGTVDFKPTIIRLEPDSASSNSMPYLNPIQNRWGRPDLGASEYMKPYNLAPMDPRLFESPEFPDFQIPKGIPESIPPMVLPDFNQGSHNWSEQYRSIYPIVPKMPSVQELNGAFAQPIGQ